MLYLYLARQGYLRNFAYRWTHMLNNAASVLFAFIYISFWQAVAPEQSTETVYTRATMMDLIILAQTMAWVSGFLPAGLGIQQTVRTGEIALHMARPVPFFPMILVREWGNVGYQALFRALPIFLLLSVWVGMPRPASAGHLSLALVSAVMGSFIGLLIYYAIGLSSLWTVEIRWAHWMHHSLLGLLSGGWIPADLLPGWLGEVAPHLPYAAMIHHPIRIYMGLSGPESLLVQLLWVLVLALCCIWLTGRALRRVVVQGG